ncbi:SDR family NAD(P)-dependent oxidoreductase [Pseudonocardia sp. NPDC049635]|uniref:SDR family NAD(P)-dependent oxidoreductase n=1 Tax=Pseudonocardia sp. NPDC049635 TaxID=3155506 RepID=UPI0033F5FC93
MALALITGGGSGIGAVLADRLASRGHDLILVGRDPERLHVTARALTARYGVRADGLVADLATRHGLFRIEALLGGPGAPALEVLVHDIAQHGVPQHGVPQLGVQQHGVQQHGVPQLGAPQHEAAARGVWAHERPVHGTAPGHPGTAVPRTAVPGAVDEQQTRIDLGVTATMRLTHAALPGMLRCGSGTVIAIGAPPGPDDDPATAWALAFTAGLAATLEGTGVRAVTVRTERAAESALDGDGPAGQVGAATPGAALLELPRRAVSAGLRAARRGAQLVSDATREPLMPAGAPGTPAAPACGDVRQSAREVPACGGVTTARVAPADREATTAPARPRRPAPAPGCDRAAAAPPLHTPSRLPDLPARPGAGRSVGAAPGCGRSDHYVAGSLRTPEQRARAAAAARNRARRRIDSAHLTVTVTGS